MAGADGDVEAVICWDGLFEGSFVKLCRNLCLFLLVMMASAVKHTTIVEKLYSISELQYIYLTQLSIWYVVEY